MGGPLVARPRSPGTRRPVGWCRCGHGSTGSSCASRTASRARPSSSLRRAHKFARASSASVPAPLARWPAPGPLPPHAPTPRPARPGPWLRAALRAPSGGCGGTLSSKTAATRGGGGGEAWVTWPVGARDVTAGSSQLRAPGTLRK